MTGDAGGYDRRLIDKGNSGFYTPVMEQITVSSAALSLRSDKPLTPAMVSALWEVVAVLDEERVPATVPNAVWLTIPTKRLRGPNARQDNVWLRECLERMTGLQLAGEFQGQEWIAVLLAEAHFIEGGSRVRILVPPAGIHALRSPGNFVKIEADAVHRLPPHARRLYALLADKKRQREPFARWSLPVLRGLLNVDDKKTYDDWYQFRRWVLDPAVEAINDFGTVKVRMTPIKEGRSVVAVKFEWQWKDPHEATETAIENERHSKARRKAQESDDAPPMIEDEPQADPALEWWGSLTDKARNRLANKVGRTIRQEGPGGKIVTTPRRESDIAREAYALHMKGTSPP